MNNCCVNDLLNKNARIVFILESPHTEEVRGGKPLLGGSGSVFSRALLPDKDNPAGDQITEKGILFTIINTFQGALQLCPSLSKINNLIRQLNFNDLGAANYKIELVKILKSTMPSSLLESYKKRAGSAICESPKVTKVVVCGLIAQAFFEFAFDIQQIRFGKVEERIILGKKIEILYVEHPSLKNKNTHWTPVVENQKLIFFRKFLDISESNS